MNSTTTTNTTAAAEQDIMTAQVQAAVDYDAEAGDATQQPALPSRSNDDNDRRAPFDTKDDGPQNSDSRRTYSFLIAIIIVVLLAMAATGVAVWFVMDSRIQNLQAHSTQSQGQSDGTMTANATTTPTLPPVSSPSTGHPLPPSLEIMRMTDDMVMKPLSMCMGDCDKDGDCDPGLMCFQRNANTPVPGCTGGLEDDSQTDYCILAPSLAIVESSSFPLGRCQGDCDSNDDCGHGLVCYQRNEFDPVPGCSGGSEDASLTDFCAPRFLVPETYLMAVGDSNKIIGNPDDNFGTSVSLSQPSSSTSEPLLMAVGAVDRGSTGYVNIYRLEKDNYNNDNWALAATIQGDEIGSDFGHSVSMSWDGKYVAVGMPKSKDGGRIKVFELSMADDSNDFDWNQVGTDITLGGGPQEYVAYAVSLSEDGSILAVTEEYSFSTFTRDDSGNWVPLGSRVDIGSFGGVTISLSGDGSRAAVNVKPNDVYPPDGYGRVYEFNGTEWTQVGQTLGDISISDSDGLNNIDLTSTSLSGDGKTVVMSCIDRFLKNSYVRVYQDIGGSEWTPKGDPILGKVDQYAPASKVEISKDGAVVAIGDYELGRVRLYEFDSGLKQWIAAGEVYAENEDDQLGVALSLAGGKGEAYLAIGGPNKRHVTGNPGFTLTYKTTFGIRPDPTFAPSSAPTEWIDGRENTPWRNRAQYVWSGEVDSGSSSIAGHSVAMSGDGTVFAYSLRSETGLNSVVVYEETDGEGGDQRPLLSGERSFDEFGYSISLSNDGLIMAVGIPTSRVGTVEGAGSVKVYQYDAAGKIWNTMGGDIVSSFLEESGRFGHSLSLNGSGDILAVGAPPASTVSIYRFENNEWVTMGEDITVPEYKYSLHGWSVSMSTDGLVVAVGGPTNEDNWDEAGACRIYEFVNNNWQLRGQSIFGGQRHGLLGSSVSLSGDGNKVAIGSINYRPPEATMNNVEGVRVWAVKSGAVFVYEFGPEGEWEPLGKPIVGDDALDRFGWSVSLTKDGKKLAAGAPEHREGGQVRLFVFDEEHFYWNQIGDVQRYDVYNGDGKSGGFGTSVALADSYDGVRMIGGAPRTRNNDFLGLTPNYAGEVSVYKILNA